MPPKNRKPSDLSGIPEFTRAIRGLAHVPKAEVDAAFEKERQAKKSRQGKKKCGTITYFSAQPS